MRLNCNLSVPPSPAFHHPAAAHGARHQQDEAPSVAYCKALMAKLVPEFKGGFYGTLFCPSDDVRAATLLPCCGRVTDR